MTNQQTRYYQAYSDAAAIKTGLAARYPKYQQTLRIVAYQKGYALQWYESGPYWPDLPTGDGLFDPTKAAA